MAKHYKKNSPPPPVIFASLVSYVVSNPARNKPPHGLDNTEVQRNPTIPLKEHMGMDLLMISLGTRDTILSFLPSTQSP